MEAQYLLYCTRVSRFHHAKLPKYVVPDFQLLLVMTVHEITYNGIVVMVMQAACMMQKCA